MKNLCKKGKVHPSPPIVSDRLSLLPATILTLAAALSAEDKEVLAYLISCSGTSSNTTSFTGHREINQKKEDNVGDDCTGDGRNHDPVFDCNCFSCYMSFWARWDDSPNRELIHEIIEVYEEGLFEKKKKNMKMKKKNKNKKEKGKRICDDVKEISNSDTEENKLKELESDSVENNSNSTGKTEDFEEKGTVRNITSFIGEKIWGFFSRN